MRDAFIAELEQVAINNPKVFLLTGDLGFGVIEQFQSNLPNQFLNAGVAEQNMMGMAAGLADSGRLPFVYSIANFPTFRCLEQIRNDVCYNELPVTVVSVGAGLAYGSLGYSHHAIEDLAIMRALPGMRVLSPCDPSEVRAAINLIVSDPGPTYLRLGKNGEPNLSLQDYKVLPNVNVLKTGRDLLILVTGSIAGDVLEVTRRSTNRVIQNAHVVSVPHIKPLTLDDLDFEKFSVVVSVEEHSLTGGLNTAIYEHFRSKGQFRQVFGVGLEDIIRRDSGQANYLRQCSGLDQSGIQSKLLQILIS